MTERDIQNAIFRDHNTSHVLICPNYTPAGWHECDVFAVTKAGYMTEWEIKLTKADFKKDSKKTETETYLTRLNESRGIQRKTKHDRLAAADIMGPSRFFYVLPEGVIDDQDVPMWAGIIRASSNPKSGRVHLNKTREAPRLHKQTISQLVSDKVRGVFYWRLWSERTRNKTHTDTKV
jgi:hypothetical protein